jgi:LytS/YehU family sensor histidine kinase
MLQAQINPHFLFNSLNTLSSLVYEDADRSAEFIRRLSDVYRHVLDARQKDLISLREELSFIESFIFLLELRFENKLKIDVRIDENLLDHKIAPLTLQMLIENAVKHNIVSDSKPLSVDIFNDDDHIVVKNPLQEKVVKEKGNNMGLRNISSRYMALCGKEVGIYNTDGAFTVKIPII